MRPRSHLVNQLVTAFTVRLQRIIFKRLHPRGAEEAGGTRVRRVCCAKLLWTPLQPPCQKKNMVIHLFLQSCHWKLQCNAASAEPSIVLHVNLSMFVSVYTAEKPSARSDLNGSSTTKNIRLVLCEHRQSTSCLAAQSVWRFQRGQQKVCLLSKCIFLHQINTWNKCSQETAF